MILGAALVLALLTLMPTQARAWDNHALGTMAALSDVRGSDENVAAEPLELFLASALPDVASALADANGWAETHVDRCPPASPLVMPKLAAFAASMRLNPNYRFTPFVQDLKDGVMPANAEKLPTDQIMLAKGASSLMHRGLLAVPLGAPVPAWLVAASASDEPDYGPDVGLFTDNGTAWGASYGFGPQPFGNPHYTFSSAAPFHMAFLHESSLLYAAAPFLKSNLPELRLAQYLGLARAAFKTGHRYWGWRFTGFGLHYVQDLTQPYHATVFPNMGTAHLIFVNALDLAGFPGQKERLIQIVNNRHLALKNYWFMRLRGASPEFVAALSDRGDDERLPAWSDSYARDVITEESHARADAVDNALTKWLPEKLVDDPKYIFGQAEPGIDVAQILKEGPPEGDRQMVEAVLPLVREFGEHTRAFVKAASAGSP